MAFLEINNFTGGLNTFIEPTFIQSNEASVLRNAQISTGSIINMNGHDEISKEGGFYMFNTLDYTGVDKWFYHEQPMVWYETTKRIYKSALGKTLPVTAIDKDGKDLGNLGIAKPTTELSINETNGGVFYKDEVYNYVFTFVSGTSAESQPSKVAQMTVTADGKAIKLNLGSQQVIPANCDKIFLYRQGGGVHSFMYVDEIPLATKEYIDTMPTQELGSNLLSQHNETPPNGLMLDTEYRSMLVGHIEGDNVLRFSQEIYVDSWSSLETIALDSPIVRATEYNGQLIVLCKTALYRITGTNVDNFSVAKVPTEQGCLSYKSVAQSRGMLFWQSEDGISCFDGGAVTVVSTNKIPKKDIAHRKFCIIARDEEILFADDKGILFCDLARGLAWRDADGTNTNIRGMFYIHKTDTVFATDGNNTYKLFNNPNKKLEMKYKTGELILGSLISLKAIKRVMLFGQGRFDVEITVDGDIAVKEIELTLDYVSPVDVLLPSGTKGRRMEFLFKGNLVESFDEQKISTIVIEYENVGVGK